VLDRAREIASELATKPALGTAMLRAFGLAKIPMLLLLGPQLVALDDRRCLLRVPLRWRVKNHLGGMYIAALVAGADCAAGMLVARSVGMDIGRVQPLFRDLNGQFHRRVEGDALFVCEEGQAVAAGVARAIATGERVDLPLHIDVRVPRLLGEEVAAELAMTLTLKHR